MNVRLRARVFGLFLLVGSAAFAQPIPSTAIAADPLAALIQKDLSVPQIDFDANDETKHVSLDTAKLKALYQLRNFKPVWVTASGVTNLGEDLKIILNDESELRGFDRRYYWFAATESRFESRAADQLAELDILMTAAYIEYATNLAQGRVDVRDDSQNLRDIEFSRNPAPSVNLLNSVVADHDALFAGLDRIEPAFRTYTALKYVLANLINAKSFGGWPAFRGRPVLHVGDSHPNVVAIRVRLVDMAALPRTERRNASPVYDEALSIAVMRLQKVMFFKNVDGVVGPSTYQLLNISLDQRMMQTRANLERWRLLPRALGEACPKNQQAECEAWRAAYHKTARTTCPAKDPNDCLLWRNRYVFVDLGREELEMIQDNMPKTRKVVVGGELRQTPTMQDRIPSVVIRPYWTAPVSIVVKDLLPKLRRNSGFLRALNMVVYRNGAALSDAQVAEIDWSPYTVDRLPDIQAGRLQFPWTFREEPGPRNSLGVIKFNLTNSHSIYMHDTDNHSLFELDERHRSSGCIRVEHPFDLANFVFDGKPDVAQSLIPLAQDESVKAKTIPLARSVKVYIFGTTMIAYTEKEPVNGVIGGIVAFRKDIYRQDQRIVDAMNGVRVAAPTIGPASSLK